MSTTFGPLLRRHRIAAGLSQEALAVAARVSTSAVGAYERGVHTGPHRQTVALLADALQLSGDVRTEFIGRDTEVERIQEMLRTRRLVTVTGIGGLGKTRVAIRAAAGAKGAFRDGVAFVDLGSLSEDRLVVARVASALKIALPEGAVEAVDVAAHLKDRHVLLLVDNCEHVLATAGSVLSAILGAAPGVSILATSRERLRIASENVYRLSTLAAPDAIELFVERVTSLASDFVLTDPRTAEIAEICAKLDGIPLALELAAARVPSMGLTRLRSELNRTIAVLSNGNRDVPTRQRTLEATLAWSFDLLEPAEQVVFRRLSVFAGGWTVEAAQGICAGPDLSEDVVVESLSSLVEKSLVTVDLDADPARYDFLQLARTFARAKADAADEFEPSRERHAMWHVALCDHDGAETRGSKSRARRIAHAELDNLRAAIEWSFQRAQTAPFAARIIARSNEVWWNHGLYGEYQAFVRAAIAGIDEAAFPTEAARLHNSRSSAATGIERVEAAEKATELFSLAGDQRAAAISEQHRAWGLALLGRLDEAAAAAERSLELQEGLGNRESHDYATTVRTRATIAAKQGDFTEARRLIEKAIAIAEAVHSDRLAARCRMSLVDFEFTAGDAAAALAGSEQVIGSARHFGLRRDEMYLVCNRAGYHLALGHADAARDDARIALEYARDNDTECRLNAMQHLATVAALLNESDVSARLLGFIDGEDKRLSRTRELAEEICYDVLMKALQADISEETIVRLREAGQVMTTDQAVDLAFSI
jgi:predicted ATPase